jgi:hypothetical protein
MNFQTDTKTASKRRHRLYVALPLFAFCAWFGLPEQQPVVQADIGIVRSEESGLIAGKSLISTTEGDLIFAGWNGAFHLDTSNPERITVAALTTPVLATRGDARWLVPVGMQLTIDIDASNDLDASWVQSHRPIKLPAHYLREKLPQAESLLEQSTVPALPQVSAVLPPLLGQSLRFEIADLRAQERNTTLQLTALVDAFQSGSDEEIDALLLEPATQQALQHAPASVLWTVLSAATAVDRDTLILPFLLDESDAALIARFHPLLSDRAWVYPSADANRSTLLAQMLLPQADRNSESRPEPVIRAWQDGWQTLLSDESQASFIRESVLSAIRTDIAALDHDGYPARARAYSDALAAVFGSDQQVIEDIQVDLTEPQSEETDEVITDSESGITEVVSEDQVRARLLGFGAMFTSQSSLTLNPDGSYTVRDIVLGTASGDRVLSFTYQPSRDLVSGIEHEGKTLPYSLPLEQYLAWVRGDK